MNLRFPILLLDIPSWDYDLLYEIIKYDLRYLLNDVSFYRNYLINKRCLDADGNVYTIVGRFKKNGFWSRFFNNENYEICLSITNEKWSFDEVKAYLNAKIETMEDQLEKRVLLSSIENSHTIRELIEFRQ